MKKKATAKRTVVRVLPMGHRGWKITRNRLLFESYLRRDRYKKDEVVSFAVTLALAIVAEGGLAQVVIHKRDGKIQEERTYPRSSDPRRSKG